ncbi:hypothetical protein D3C77_550070 [compost metagenome]
MPLLLPVQLELLGDMPPFVLHLLQLTGIGLLLCPFGIPGFAQLLQLLLALHHLSADIIESASKLAQHILAFANVCGQLIQLALPP